jgi:hypothetical protein
MQALILLLATTAVAGDLTSFVALTVVAGLAPATPIGCVRAGTSGSPGKARRPGCQLIQAM